MFQCVNLFVLQRKQNAPTENSIHISPLIFHEMLKNLAFIRYLIWTTFLNLSTFVRPWKTAPGSWLNGKVKVFSVLSSASSIQVYFVGMHSKPECNC